MRILALDYGTARIGAAVSDPDGLFAQPLEAIHTRGVRGRRAKGGRAGESGPLARIAALVREYAVEQIVVGLPLHMDGRAGEQAAMSRRFGDQVAAHTGLPVAFLDERWTTQEAGRALDELGLRGARRKERLDAAAAALLLRAYIGRRSSQCGGFSSD